MRRSPDASQNGDRALKAARGISQIGLMIARYFISVTVDVMLEMATERFKAAQGTSQIGLMIALYFYLLQRLMLRLYFCLRQKLTVPSLTWNASLTS